MHARFFSLVAFGIASLSIGTASAAVCDDPHDAWRVVDDAQSARRRGEVADVERAAAPLLHCTVTRTTDRWIARAALEARLAVLQTRADIALATIRRLPVAPNGTAGQQYRHWINTTFSPWLVRQLSATRIVVNEAGTIAGDAASDPAIAAEAIGTSVRLQAAIVDAVNSLPMPSEFRADAAIARAYRESIESNTNGLVRTVREGSERIESLGRHGTLLPADARRAAAFLALQGGASASPSPSSASAPSVAAGTVRSNGGDNGLPSSAIRDAVQQSQESLEVCYERGLDRTPTLHGDVVVRFVVGIDGRIAAASVTRADEGLREVADCMVHALRSLRFNAPRAVVTVDYPFRLEPASASTAP